MDNLTYSLRPATADDVPAIVEIEKQIHIAPWTEEHFVAELSKPYSCFLIFTDDETDNQITGYMVCWLLFDECQILNIGVNTPFRGLGFAKKMLRMAAHLASQKNLKRVTLEVRKSNLPAIQLYQNLKFVITQVRKSFYNDGEDAYFMKLSLEEDPLEF